MNRYLYVLIITLLTGSLAACGKAVSSAPKQTEPAVFFEEDGLITAEPDKINVGFLQASNLYEWQVEQTESFYTAFAKADEYHLSIVDAHGDASKQREQFEEMLSAPMELLILVPVDEEVKEDLTERAEAAGIPLVILETGEDNVIYGEELLEQIRNGESPG